jgi:hypothetical protein
LQLLMIISVSRRFDECRQYNLSKWWEQLVYWPIISVRRNLLHAHPFQTSWFDRDKISCCDIWTDGSGGQAEGMVGVKLNNSQFMANYFTNVMQFFNVCSLYPDIKIRNHLKMFTLTPFQVMHFEPDGWGFMWGSATTKGDANTAPCQVIRTSPS